MGNEGIRVECSETSPVVRSVSVEVDAARVSKAFDRAYRELGKSARVRGFRPGKVPRSVLERLYGSSLPEQVEHTLVSETLMDAVARAELEPLLEPDVDAALPETGQPFRYTLRVEVKPRIELPEVAGLPAKRPRVEVAEAEVEAQLERMRERSAPLVEVDEQVEVSDGHIVTLNFEGRIDGKPFEGGSGQGVDIEIGAGRFIPGFEEKLVGGRAGERREIEVSFPDDYGVPRLDGKQAVFDAEIVTVRTKQLPELDDEFAKDMGEFENLEDLRVRIRKDIREGREAEAQRVLQRSLMDSLLERVEFEVPPGVVEQQLQRQLQSMHSRFQGQVPDEVLQRQLERLQQDGRPAAGRRVREAFLLDALAEAREIEVGEEALAGRIAELAEAQGVEPARMRNAAREQGWLQAIERDLRDELIYEALAAEAEVEEVDLADETDETGEGDEAN